MNNEKKENLASEVKKWPLLYDKSDKNYKNSVGGSGLGESCGEHGMEGLFLLIKPCAVHSDVKFHVFFAVKYFM